MPIPSKFSTVEEMRVAALKELETSTRSVVAEKYGVSTRTLSSWKKAAAKAAKKPKKHYKPDEIIQVLKAAYLNKTPNVAVAKTLNVDPVTVYHWKRRHKQELMAWKLTLVRPTTDTNSPAPTVVTLAQEENESACREQKVLVDHFLSELEDLKKMIEEQAAAIASLSLEQKALASYVPPVPKKRSKWRRILAILFKKI